MRRLVAAALLLAACTPSKPDAPAGGAADTAASAAPAPTAAGGPQAIVTVVYNTPKDTAAFEKYYRETHLPLVSAGQSEIGFTKAELTRFTSNLDGTRPTFYRQAELYFPSMDALDRGIATPAFKAVADDLPKFATGGLLALVATETGDASDAPCPALVTVIYDTPKDSAAFERYYGATHVPLVGKGQGEIGFQRADLTRFVRNVDGSPPARYRQAELCFTSMDALTKGTGTAAFKAVADDLPNFASGGLTGLIGTQE